MIKGIHHVSIKCSSKEFDDVKKLYRDALGCSVAYEFPNGCLMDTGCGFIEVFNDGEVLPQGEIRHFALEVTSADETLEKCRALGYDVIMEPKSVNLSGLLARICFIKGAAGEEIEFFEVRKNG